MYSFMLLWLTTMVLENDNIPFSSRLSNKMLGCLSALNYRIGGNMFYISAELLQGISGDFNFCCKCLL